MRDDFWKMLEDRAKCYEGCRAINPDAPVKVAEALPELVEALKECQKWLEESPEGDNATGLAIAALTKLKAQP